VENAKGVTGWPGVGKNRRRAGGRLFADPPQIVSPQPRIPYGHECFCGFTTSKEEADMLTTAAKYHIGQVLRHRKHPFRGVVFDVDAIFSNTDEWYENIPEEARPAKDQPFYHLLAENDQSYYVAYVSEQNLVPDETGEPVTHPDLPDLFGDFEDGRYPLQVQLN
jgi:heat shock protein HspQ